MPRHTQEPRSLGLEALLIALVALRKLGPCMRIFALVVVSVFGASPTIALAEQDSRARARELAVEGIELMERERWEEAHTRLSEAYDLFQAPTVLVLDAKALERMGRLTAAHARFQEAVTLPLDDQAPQAFHRAAEQAVRERDRLAKLIPRLSVSVRGPQEGLTVQVNGEPLAHRHWGKARLVDPGSYTVLASTEGRIRAKETVVVQNGSHATIVLSLTTPPPPVRTLPERVPAPSQSPALAWVSLGVGAAGLTTGVVAGAVMLDAKRDLDAKCTPDCPQASRPTLERFRSARSVSIAGYSAGAVGIGLGIWFLLAAAEPDVPVTGGLAAGPDGGQLELRGWF